MNLLERLRDQRDRHILRHAESHLEEGEDVWGWVRIRHPHRRWKGYAFVTPRKLLIVWAGREGARPVEWDELDSWDVDLDTSRGPTMAVNVARTSVECHIPVGSRGTARRATAFLRALGRLAAEAQRAPASGTRAAPRPDEVIVVSPQKRSAVSQTKRIVVTVVGLIGVVGGFAITPIPGPWSLPLVLGGLALLASEHDWAEDVLDWARELTRQAKEKLSARRAAREE